MTKTETAHEFIRPTEAANRLGVSVKSINNWLDAGKLKGQRTPYGRLIDAEDLERLRKERANGRG